MGISTNKVRIGPMVHSLYESGVQTRCGLQGVAVTMAPWISGEKINEPVDCMTCLVDRESELVRDAKSMGTGVAHAFMRELSRVLK